MKNQRKNRIFACLLMLVLVVCFMSVPALAAGETNGGDVAGAIDGIWSNASGQMKTICNNVVFPALSWVCGIMFVVAAVMSVINYKKHHTLDVGWPIALLIALIISVTAKSWVWTLIGT